MPRIDLDALSDVVEGYHERQGPTAAILVPNQTILALIAVVKSAVAVERHEQERLSAASSEVDVYWHWAHRRDTLRRDFEATLAPFMNVEERR